MTPYNTELIDSYNRMIKKEKSEATFFFRDFRDSLYSSFQGLYEEGFDSKEDMFNLVNNPLSLECIVPKKGREISTIECKQVFFEIYRAQKMALLKQLVEISRENFSFFANHELESVVTKKSDIFVEGEEITEEMIHNVMVDYPDYLCILDDTGEEDKYYMLLQASWNPEKDRNKELNEFYDIDKNSKPLYTE